MWGQDITWERVTSIATLRAGGTFIMGYEATANSGVIIPLRTDATNATTSANGYLYSGTGTETTSNNGTINMSSVTATGKYELYITASSVTDAINMQLGNSGGNYIGCPNSKNTAKLYTSASANTAYTLTVGTNNYFTLECKAADTGSKYKYLKFNNNTGSYRYANYSTTPEKIVFYKKVIKYTVTYDANGGSGTMEDSNSPYVAGATVTLLDNEFTAPAGKEFNGWSVTDASSNAVAVSDNQFTMPAKDVTVTAQWQDIAGEYILVNPTSANIATEGDVAEFGLTTNLASPSYSVAYFTSSTGDVTTTKPTWIGDVEFSGNTLYIEVDENTGAARSAYLKVYSGSTYSSIITINQAVATYEIAQYTLPATAHGTITFSPESPVETGAEVTLTATPAAHYTFTADSWVFYKESGNDIVVDNSITVTNGKITMPAYNLYVDATFTETDGSIDLRTTGEITFGNWSSSILGSSYGDRECELTGSDNNTYYWNEEDGYYNDGGWQIKKSSGKVTSPTIKSNYGFTISVTKKTNNVIISDGTNSGQNSLTTTKTSTAITIVGDGAYAVFTAIKITPLKAPVATDVAITDPGTLAKGATGTFAYTKTTEEANTKEWKSSNASVIEITDAATGAYEAKGRGTAKITLTLNPTDATNYREVSAELNVNVTEPVDVSANDVTMTYGDAAKTIGATTSTGYAGTLSYQSGNANIATIDDASGKVTAVAAGTTTITISAPADAEHLYSAGETVINVTVNTPVGETTTTPKTIVSESLLSNDLPSTWTGDGTIWHGESSYGAVTSAGTIGNTYDLTTGSINLSNYSDASVTFQHTGNNTFSTSGDGRANACKLFVKDGNTETQLTINTMFEGNNWTYVTNNTDLTAYIGKNIQLIFRYTPSEGNQGKWEVKNFKIEGTPVVTANVAASGYGSYCYEYPIDLDKLDENVKAYIVTNACEGNVTFKQITGTIKGGVPFILYGTAGAHTLTLAASSNNVPENNMLKGTLSPKYITTVEGDYTNFGLSGGKFVKINNGTLPVNKAYLPILTSVVESSTGAPTFDIIFDEGTTGVENVNRVTINDNKYYTLDGRCVENPTKGLYIVNGKKVMIK